MPNKLPSITVSNIKENKDGSIDISFDYDLDFELMVKKSLKLKKNPTQKQIEKFILKCLEETAGKT